MYKFQFLMENQMHDPSIWNRKLLWKNMVKPEPAVEHDTVPGPPHSSINQASENIDANNASESNATSSTENDTCANIHEKFLFWHGHTLFQYAQLITMITFTMTKFFTSPFPAEEGSFYAGMEKLEVACYILFPFLLVVRLVGWRGLEGGLIIVDILTVIGGLILVFADKGEYWTRYVRAFCCIRLFLFIEITPLKIPYGSLIKGMKNISKLLLPAVAIIYIYAIIGLHAFNQNEFSRCRHPSVLQTMQATQSLTYTKQIFLCGIRQCPFYNNTQYQCINPLDYGIEPNQQQLQHIQLGYGLLTYQNIFYSILNTSKIIFITGWSRMATLEKQVLPSGFVLVYFLSFLFLMSYIYMSIVYGLMMSNQSDRRELKKLTFFEEENKNPVEISEKSEKGEKKNTIYSGVLLIFQRAISMKENQTEQEKVEFLEEDPQPMKFPSSSLSDQKDRSSEKQNRIYLHENFYLPPHLGCQSFFNKLCQAYKLFNCIMIIICCSNLLIEYSSETKEIQFMRGIIDFICFIQFVLHVIGFIIIERIKQIKLDEWWKQNKLKPVENFKVNSSVLKSQLIIMFFTLAGFIIQIVYSKSFEAFLTPSTKEQKILRSIKYFRVVVLLVSSSYFTEIRAILVSSGKSVIKIIPFTVLYFFISIVFSFIGYNLFTEKTDENSTISFNNPYESFIFVLLTFYNEEWDYLMYKQYPIKGTAIVIFQIITIFIGLIILTKYYMAILMYHFGIELDLKILEDQIEEEQANNKVQNQFEEEDIVEVKSKSTLREKKETLVLREFIQLSLNNKSEELQSVNENPIANKNRILPFNGMQNTSNIENTKLKGKKKKNPLQKSKANTLNFNTLKVEKASQNNSENIDEVIKVQQVLKTTLQKQIVFKTEKSQKSEQQEKKNEGEDIQNIQKDQECCEFLFEKIRLILESRVYMFTYITAILLSIIEAGIRSPLVDRFSKQYQVWSWVEMGIGWFFFLDMLISIIAYGLIRKPTSYLKRSKTNPLNMILTLLTIPVLFPKICTNYYIFKMGKLKVLRIFIILNYICSFSPGMKFTIIGITKSIPQMIKLFLTLLVFYCFFAIILVIQFSNQLWYCEGFYEAATIKNKTDCFNYGGNWLRYEMHTDNTPIALLYLLMIGSTEGWLSLMLPLSSIRGKNLQPEINANPHIRLFFLFFFFVGNIVILNVFIGLSIQAIKTIKKEQTGENSLSKDEKDWLSLQSRIYHISLSPRITPDEGTFKYYLYKLINHPIYKILNLLIMVAYFIKMSFSPSSSKKQIMTTIDYQYFFICLSVIFFFLQMIGRVKKIKKGLIIFQMMVLSYVIIFAVLYYTGIVKFSQRQLRIYGSIFIAIQLFRYSIYLNQITYFRKTFNFLKIILPHTFYIFVFMITILTLYSFLGTEFFAYLRSNTELNSFDQNYQNVWNSMYSLIKFSTWQSPIDQITNAATNMKPNFICFDVHNFEDYQKYGLNGCGNIALSYGFFITFHLIYSIILMSSLIATIFDAYCEVKEQEEMLISEFQLEEVTEGWLHFDPEANGFLPYHNFWRFVSKLHQIYQLSDQKVMSVQNKQSFLAKLDIPVYSDSGALGFEFYETVSGLTRIMLSKKYQKQIATEKANEIFRQRHSFQPTKDQSQFTSEHVFSIILLRQGLRHWRSRTKKSFVPGIFNNIRFR